MDKLENSWIYTLSTTSLILGRKMRVGPIRPILLVVREIFKVLTYLRKIHSRSVHAYPKLAEQTITN